MASSGYAAVSCDFVMIFGDRTGSQQLECSICTGSLICTLFSCAVFDKLLACFRLMLTLHFLQTFTQNEFSNCLFSGVIFSLYVL